MEKGKKKCPLVAIRHLELVNQIADEAYRVNSHLRSLFDDIYVCDPDSPIRVSEAFCEKLRGSGFNPPPVIVLRHGTTLILTDTLNV